MWADILQIGPYRFTWLATCTLAAGGLALATGVFGLLRERQARQGVFFLLFCLVVSISLVSTSFMYAAPSPERARGFSMTGYLAVPFIPATLYHLILEVVDRVRERRAVLGGIWTVASGFLVLTVGAEAMVEGFVREPWGWTARLGAAGTVLAAFLAVGMGASLWELWTTWRRSPRREARRRALNLLVGIGLGTGATVDFLPAVGVDIAPLGFIAVVAALLVIGRAIWVHRLVDFTPAFASEAVLKTMADPLLVCSADGRIRLANAAAEDVLGFAPDELADARVWELAPDRHREELRRLVEAPSPANRELTLRSRRGEEVAVSVSSAGLEDEDGETVGAVLVARDIRPEKAARQALERSEEKYSKLVRTSPLGIVVTHLETGEVLEVNDAALEMFGYEAEDIRGRTTVELDAWDDPAARERFAREAEARDGIEGWESRLRTRTGEPLDALLFAEPIELAGETCLVTTILDVTEQKELERELRRQALHDHLTGLPNRALLHDRVEQALARCRRDGHDAALAVLDAVRFREVNDSFGQAAGDRVLVATAERVRGTLRGRDTVARVGGDQFAVLLEEVDGEEATRRTLERIRESLSAPFQAGGEEFRLRFTAGVALLEAERDGALQAVDGPDDVIRFAESALDRAKQQDHEPVFLLRPGDESEGPGLLHREQELRRAIEEDQFDVHYQPVVDLDTGQVVGVEALARWPHPERGMVSPGEFIPLAEETGLIHDLGRRLLRIACRRLRSWNQSAPEGRGLQLWFNLSARQLSSRQLPEEIARILDEEGMEPEGVTLEVTETALMRGSGQADRLKEMGLGLAIDDFGTGYSSFAYLKKLEVDALKIDRSFVQGLGVNRDDTAIVEAVAALGAALDVDVVAEGIETAEQEEHVRRAGCRLAQGFHFARPQPAEAAADVDAWERLAG